ncbi:MAG: pantetheine-phosphate adenylyltransferase [Alphaproteobacteria bacterium]|jgi:pantetheine-phosphate adenylyltransferase|nr:pantetheine-phosphate adenylyltransferase [Alphaproteobacteria bacterium]MDP6515159.1 pantetheine-phosphate adenylyltransferase [Alphaproteobacteria bacterium]
MNREVRGVYPGTFDPPTCGHLDIIRRALHVVDRLIVGVAVNAGKGPMFGLDERCAMVEEASEALGEDFARRITVRPFDSLLMHFVKASGASVIVRGLRAVSDFEYEFQMTGMNARLEPEVETVFLMASEQTQFISSRLVKEIAVLGGDVAEFVPANVQRRLAERIAESRGPKTATGG